MGMYVQGNELEVDLHQMTSRHGKYEGMTTWKTDMEINASMKE